MRRLPVKPVGCVQLLLWDLAIKHCQPPTSSGWIGDAHQQQIVSMAGEFLLLIMDAMVFPLYWQISRFQRREVVRLTDNQPIQLWIEGLGDLGQWSSSLLPPALPPPCHQLPLALIAG